MRYFTYLLDKARCNRYWSITAGANHMNNDTSQSPLHNRGLADARPDSENRDDRKSRGNDTRQLIIEVAGRLFRQIGFHKTTVGDIARELHMSSANVYRFFTAKSDINEAVCMDLLNKIEAEAEKITASPGTAAQKIRTLIGSVHTTHYEQYNSDRNLYELIEASITDKWAAMRQHRERMIEISAQIIASGMASGEFPAGDAALASRLVDTACLRFRDPRLIVEHEQELEPTLDEMCDFCITAISYKRKVVYFPLGEEIEGE
jgi:AcrR family transcriptional regulator